MLHRHVTVHGTEVERGCGYGRSAGGVRCGWQVGGFSFTNEEARSPTQLTSRMRQIQNHHNDYRLGHRSGEDEDRLVRLRDYERGRGGDRERDCQRG